MKKIINKKTYNTETANLIAQWDNGHCISDFYFCSENLYRTQKGQFFIHGDSGAAGKYSTSCGNNSRSGGSDLVLLTDNEAYKWLEENGFTDIIEEIFGEEIEEG